MKTTKILYSIEKANPFTVRKGDYYILPSAENNPTPTKIKEITSSGFKYKKGKISGYTSFNAMEGVILCKNKQNILILMRNNKNFEYNCKELEKLLNGEIDDSLFMGTIVQPVWARNSS